MAVRSRRARGAAPRQVVAAGRTDAGVHARAMVFHFDADPTRGTLEELRRVLSRGLPEGLQVYALDLAPSGFHARQSCVGKRYVYRLLHGAGAMWERRFCWAVNGAPLDVDAMREAAERLVGEHDFSAFSLAEQGDKSCADPRGPVRRLWRLQLLHEPGPSVGAGSGGETSPQRVLVVLEADRFLRKMARMLVGSLVEVGQGRRDAAELEAVLRGAARTAAVVTAPARGLMLDGVMYAAEDDDPTAHPAVSSSPAAARVPGWPTP